MNVRGVLIVTNERDLHADFVVRELVDRHGAHVVRVNTERAAEWRLSLEPGRAWRVVSTARTLASEDCAGVWWRRPQSPPRPEHVEQAAWEAVREQWRALFAGLASVPGPRWVSSPFAIRTAESKALQLRHAEEAGFRTPGTVWTNELASARRQLSEHDDESVCKPLASAHWESDEVSHFVFARPIGSADLPSPEQLAPSPVAFQQMIAPKRDVRATVVGARVIAAIREPSAAGEALDWRLAPDSAWRAHDLPSAVADACRGLVRAMSLRFAGIDLLFDERGDYWFVELNPNGEWAWLQAAGLPIAEALADELLGA